MTRQKTKVKYISLQDAAKQTSYSQEYLSLRARQGKLRALKIGRNWVTTKGWLKEYIKISGKTPGVNGAELQQTPGVSAKFFAPPANLPVEVRGIRAFRDKIPIGIPIAQVFKLTGALALVLLFTVAIHSIDLPTKGEKLALQVPNYVKNFSEGFDRSVRSLALRTHFAVQELGKGFDTGLPTAVANIPSLLEQTVQQSNKQIQVFSEGFSYGLASPASVETFAKDYGEWLFKQTTSLPQGYVTLDQKVSEGLSRDIFTISEGYKSLNTAVAQGIQNNIQGLGEGVNGLTQKAKGGFFAFRNAVGNAVDRAVGGVREKFAKKPQPVAQEPQEASQGVPPSQEAEPQPTAPIAPTPPTTQVVREVQVLNSAELALLKAQVAGILTWRGDIDSLKAITQKIQSSPPQYGAVNAPVYIGSSGVQVAGNVSASSIGATMAGAQNLGVGLSATIGETNNANSKLTVNAESFFNSPMKLTSSFNVGTSALNNLTIATSGNVETKGSIKVLNSSDVPQVTLGTDGNITITGTLTAQGGASISGGTTTLSALSVTGNTVLGDAGADTIEFKANSLALTNSLNIDSNTLYIDASNNKIGLGTLTPARMLEILGAGPQLRISSDASNYTDLSHAAAGFFTINTTGSGIGLVDGLSIGSTYSSTTPPSDGLLVQGNVGIGNTSPSTTLDITGTLNATGASTLGATLAVTGATTLSSTLGVTGASTLSSTLAVAGISTFSSPARITVNDAITNAITTLLTLDHNTTGTAAAGIGNRISFRTENAGATLNEIGRLDVSLTTATSAAEDATLAFTGIKAGTLTEYLSLGAAAAIFNDSNADIDFRVEGDNATTLFIVDAGLDALQISPAGTRASAASATWDGFSIPATTATITGSTNITTATGFNLVNISQPTIQDNDAGTVTITNAATVYIANAPTAGGSTPPTISNAYALWVDNGAVKFDGNVTVLGTLTVSGLAASNGDVDLGDTAADTITFVGVVDSDIVPDASSTRNIGSSSKRWATGYYDTIDATTLSGTVSGGSVVNATWTINSDNATNNAEISALAFETGSGSGAAFNAVLQWNALGDAGRFAGYDNNLVSNFPISIISQVSGGNQTFTGGSLFNYGQAAAHAITQTSAFAGLDIDFNSNITVPNSSSGNQTGVLVTLKDGGASATSTGFQTAGTFDYGLYVGGTPGTADIRLSNGETIDNFSDATVNIGADALRVSNTNATTSTIDSLFTLNHSTTGTAAAGFGSRISFGLENAGNTLNEAARIDVSLTDATSASEDAAFAFSTVVNGTMREFLNLGSNAVNFGNATTNPTFGFLGTGAVTIAGSADGTDALILTLGDILVTNGDLDLSGGDFNVTLDAGDTANITKTGANAGDVANIAGTSVNAINGLTLAVTSTADAAVDANTGLNITWTESTDADTFTALNIGNTTTTNSATTGIFLGTGWDSDINATTDLTIAIGGTNELTLTATALAPSTDSGQDLGTSSSQFADLFLDGGNINLDNATDVDVDNTVASVFTVSEGSNNFLAISTDTDALNFGNATTNPTFGFLGTGLITIAGAGAETNSLTLTTGNITLTDGDLTISSGEIAATSDDATGTNFSFTTGALTTGTGLAVASTSNAYTAGSILTASLTQSAATGTAVSGDITSISFAPTYSTAVTTPAITGNVLDISRTSTTNTLFASTLTVSGALVTISDTSTQTTGTLTHTANVLVVDQNYASSTGNVLHVENAGTGNSIEIAGAGTRSINSTSANFTISTTTSGDITINPAGQTIFLDDDVVNLGTSQDIALVLSSAGVAANTALTDVLVGTPVSAATPANSFLLSNITASGDIVFFGNTGGNSQEYLRFDTSAGLAVFNEAGADIDFRIESDANDNIFAIDAGAYSGQGNISFGGGLPGTITANFIRATPTVTFTTANDYAYLWSGAFTTAAGGTLHANTRMGASVTTAAAADVYSVIAQLYLDEPQITLGAGSSATASAALYIETAATEATNNYALFVDSGKVRIDGGGTSAQTSAAGGVLEIQASTVNGNNASGTIAIGAPVSIGVTTYTNNAATLTVTQPASLYIAGIPVASTNVAFSNTALALWVDGGTSRFDGAIAFGDETVDIGTTTVGLNDLHFGSGGIINFDGGDVTLTHAANKLTFDGGDFHVADGNGVVIGHTAQIATTGITAEFQVLGTAAADSSGTFGRFAADAAGPGIFFAKGRDAIGTATTAVSAGDTIGRILSFGADTTDFGNAATEIRFEADATFANDDTPGRILFMTTADGASAVTERMRINNAGVTILGSGEGGTTAATGNTFRAPNITTGGAGNIAGADLTIAAGLGTGTGDPGQIIFNIPLVAATGDIIQTLTSGLVLDTQGIVFNEDSADIDFRVESDGNANAFVLDAGQNDIGIGGAPSRANLLDITGTFTPASNISSATGVTIQPTITAKSTAAEIFGLDSLAALTTQGATQTIGLVAQARFTEPNITVGTGDTVTRASTLMTSGVPTEATSNMALYITGTGTANYDVAASSGVATGVVALIQNSTNSGTAAAHSVLDIAVGGTSCATTCGDPQLRLTVPGGTSWYMGVDNSASDIWRLGLGTAVGTTAILTADGRTTGTSQYNHVYINAAASYTITNSADARVRQFSVQASSATFTTGAVTSATALYDFVAIAEHSIALDAAVATTFNKVTALSVNPIIPNHANLTLTESSGVRVINPSAITGTLTNLSGFYVEALTRGTNNYGLYINTPTGTIAEAIHTEGGTVRFNASGDASSDFIVQSDANSSFVVFDASPFSGQGSIGFGAAPDTTSHFFTINPTFTGGAGTAIVAAVRGTMTIGANQDASALYIAPLGIVGNGTNDIVSSLRVEDGIYSVGTVNITALISSKTIYTEAGAQSVTAGGTTNAGNFAIYQAVAAGATNLYNLFQNTTNTGSAAAHSIVDIAVGGTSCATACGDPQLRLTVPSGTSWYMGVDNSVTSPTADELVIGTGTAVGTQPAVVIRNAALSALLATTTGILNFSSGYDSNANSSGVFLYQIGGTTRAHSAGAGGAGSINLTMRISDNQATSLTAATDGNLYGAVFNTNFDTGNLNTFTIADVVGVKVNADFNSLANATVTRRRGFWVSDIVDDALTQSQYGFYSDSLIAGAVTNAQIALVTGSPTVAATTDLVQVNAVDIAATDARLAIQSESGSAIYIGNDRLRFAAATGYIQANGADELTLTATALSPSVSDGNALGTTSLMWSDLFLASGGVINFNNGDVTLTHASNVLAIEGGDVGIGTTSPKGILHVASSSIVDDLILNQGAITNLVSNPSFEVDTTGWTFQAGGGAAGSFARDTTDSRIGVAQAKLVVTTIVGTNPRFYIDIADGSLTNGQTYTASFYAKADSAGTIIARLYDAADGAGCSPGAVLSVTTSWQRFSVPDVYTAAGCSDAILIFQTPDTVTSYYFDAIQFELASSATPYADGSLGPGYTWTGTAHASTSTRVAGAAFGYQTLNMAGGLGSAKSIYIGDSTNANMAIGLTINGAGNDTQHLAFKNNDVVTGLSSITSQNVETDDFAVFSKADNSGGGLKIQSMSETSTAAPVMRFLHYGGAASTTKSTSGDGLINFELYGHDGANALANIAADGNLLAVRGYVGGALSTAWILDEDGDTWQNGGITVLNAQSNPSTAGAIRLPNAQSIGWRNSENDRNWGLNLDASEVFVFRELGEASTVGVQARADGNASPAYFEAYVESTATGAADPQVRLTVNGGTSWYMGADNSDSDIFKIGVGTAVGTTPYIKIDPTTAPSATLNGIVLTMQDTSVANGTGVAIRDVYIEGGTTTHAGTTTRTGTGTSAPTGAIIIGPQLRGDGSGVIITEANGLIIQPGNPGTSLTISDNIGLHVVDTAGSTQTRLHGILVDDMTSGTADFGITIRGADTQVLWLGSGADNTDAANGIAFGQSRDTNLYRAAAGKLKIARSGDTSIVVETTDTGATSYASLYMTLPASSSASAYTRYVEGTGTGAANNMAYYVGYDAGNNYYKIVSLDVDGASGDADVLRIPDGQLTIDGNSTFDANAFDYAEWMQKENPAEVFNKGDIVGIKNGKVSHNTSNAEMVMVVSTEPSFRGGNAAFDFTKAEEDAYYAKSVVISFIGQVPAKIIGSASVGDLVLPSGNNDGTGIAVSRSTATPSQFASAVGTILSEFFIPENAREGLKPVYEQMMAEADAAEYDLYTISVGVKSLPIQFVLDSQITIDATGNLVIGGASTTTTINGITKIDTTALGAGNNNALCHLGDGAAGEILGDCPGTPADVAEYYETDGTVQAGDAVSLLSLPRASSSELALGKAAPLQVKQAVAGDEKLAVGVVSTLPNLAIGELKTALYPKPVALVGRVPVRVSSANGAIVPGDSLALSDIPGVLVKATKAGVVMGRAMEAFDGNVKRSPKTEELIEYMEGGKSDARQIEETRQKLQKAIDALNRDFSNDQGLILMYVSIGWQGNDLSVTQTADGQIANLDPEQLRAGLANLGLAVNTNGMLEVDTLVARKVKAQRVELTDQRNGDVYCTWIDYGVLTTVLGECDTIELTGGINNQQLAINSTSNQSTSTSSTSSEPSGSTQTSSNTQSTNTETATAETVTFTTNTSSTTTISDTTSTTSTTTSTTSPSTDGVTSTNTSTTDTTSGSTTLTTSPSDDGVVAVQN